MGRIEPLAVTDKQVFGDVVYTVADATGMQNLLRPERHKHRCTFGGQSTKCSDPAQTVGQYRIKPVLLLITQYAKAAAMLIANGNNAVGICIQFLETVCCMHKGDKAKNHTLVTGCQVIKELF